ncbi:MAG: MFS transporter [Methyloligellaceae bacterium]
MSQQEQTKSASPIQTGSNPELLNPQDPSYVLGKLLVTTVTLAASTWGMLLYTTAATVVTSEFGYSATAIGYHVSLAYFAAMICSLYAGNATVIIGARRSLILAMLLVGFGALITTVFGLYGMFFGALLMGSGHGLTNPASAILLQSASLSSRRSLLFSIKQSGAPVGGLLTAIVTPAMTQNFGWRSAGFALAVACLATAVLTWALGRKWGTAGKFRKSFSSMSLNPLTSLTLVFQSAGLRALAFMAMCYSCVQICILSFLSPYLVEELGLTLIIAGSVVALAQIGGGIGRPLWGWTADRIGKNALMLRILGIVTAIGCLLPLVGSAPVNVALISVLVLIFGTASVGWNGVMFAEIVNISDRSSAAQATSGVAAMIFTAVMVGPSLFAIVKELAGPYSLTIALFSVMSLTGVFMTIILQKTKTIVPDD